MTDYPTIRELWDSLNTAIDGLGKGMEDLTMELHKTAHMIGSVQGRWVLTRHSDHFPFPGWVCTKCGQTSRNAEQRTQIQMSSP